METPQEYYERLRKIGLTDDITSNPDPDYNQSFYQNIFRLMDGYAKLCVGNQFVLKNAALPIFDVSGSLPEFMAEFLKDTNKRGTINRGSYVDIAEDFIKRWRQ